MPAKPSEFEEKEYEAPLYNQLESGTNLIWSPGQVFEHHIGIDRAMLLQNPAVWKVFGYDRALPGVLLETYDWNFIWRRRQRRPLPDFKLNLFVQAKRCYFYNRRPGHLKGAALHSPCWRFNIEEVQQEAFERVEDKIRDRALLCYAAPVFHRLTQLYAHTRSCTIVQNSTFPSVGVLSGHSAWYFDSPGGSGVANPQPEAIDGPDLSSLLGGFIRENADQRNHSVAQLASLINEGLSDLGATNSRVGIYFERIRALRRAEEEYFIYSEEARAFADVATFADTFHLEWFVVGRPL